MWGLPLYLIFSVNSEPWIVAGRYLSMPPINGYISHFILTAYTGAIRTSIPALSGHPFRFNPDTDSGINQPVFC